MFERYLHEIAEAYRALPERGAVCTEANTLAGWHMLAGDAVERAAGVRLLLNVRETDNPEPYPSAAAMCEDIANGHFTVSRAYSEHPIWTVDQNVAFRIVHDVLGHYAASVANGYPADYVEGDGPRPLIETGVAGFDWEGEVLACTAHVRLLSHKLPRIALFTECLGQTAAAIDSDTGFGDQKIGDLGPLLPAAGTVRNGLRGDYLDWVGGR